MMIFSAYKIPIGVYYIDNLSNNRPHNTRYCPIFLIIQEVLIHLLFQNAINYYYFTAEF
jgi:hypothetical protein